jgi:integrase
MLKNQKTSCVSAGYAVGPNRHMGCNAWLFKVSEGAVRSLKFLIRQISRQNTFGKWRKFEMARRGENIYKRKDGRYEGRYIKGRSMEGKARFGYVYGYIYAEVKATLTLAKAAARQSAPVRIIGKGSLADFLCFWLENVMYERVKTSTYAQYHERIYTHIVPMLGQIPVCRLTKEQAQAFVNGLSEKRLSHTTVRSIAGVLCSAMKKAVELRLASVNPCVDLSLPQGETKERRALDRSEQIRLERLLPLGGHKTELGVLIALYAGLRIGEICALRWRDIDLSSDTLTVRGTLQRVKNLGKQGPKTKIVEGTPKSKRSKRIIPLPAGLAEKLRSYRNDTPASCYILSGSEIPIEPHTFRKRFNRLSVQAGLDVSFHTLRHTFATRCLEHNFDIQTVSELLGHATASVTIQVYAHSVFEHKRLLTSRVHILSEVYKPSNEPSAAVSAC